MQNFTFGRKGTNWFLFTFVMLIGTLPSFGQEDCPGLADSNPDDFCYLNTIEDLTVATSPDETVEWYRDAALTQPIPSNELLENGFTYYAGNPEGNCQNPEAVTVTVEVLDAPVSEYGNVYSPYLESENANRTIGDLTEAIDSTQLGNEIVVYETQYGTDSYEETDNLVAGQSYFVGQTSTTSTCYSLRIAIRYSPDVAPAPSAESPQALCEGAIVADLVATGSEDTQAFRWYSTDTSNPALDDDDELITGTYYVSQIVNDEDSPFPPTESEERTAVEVTVISFDAGEDVAIKLCQSTLLERLENETTQEIFLSLVEGRDLPSEVSFDPTITSIESEYVNNPIDTFTTQATFTTEEGCEDTVQLSIEVEDDFEAGDDNLGNTVCRSDFNDNVTEDSIQAYLNGLLSQDAEENGAFTPSSSDIADDINASTDEISFEVTYTVGEGTSCEDFANLEFTVLESPEYDLVTVGDLCNADIPALVNEIPEDVEALFLENFGENIPQGEFEEGDIQAVINEYNSQNIGTFTATYTVTSDNGCSESVELSRTVIAEETADAGEIADIEDVCTNAEPIDLTSLIDPDATQGGNFTGEGVTNNIFDPSTLDPDTYTITYTVDESLFCVEGTATTTFTIEVIQGPYAGQDIAGSICITELEEIVTPNIGNTEAIIEALFGRFDFDGDTGGTIESNQGNIDEIGTALFAYYTNPERDSSFNIEGEYTVVDTDGLCGPDVSNFNITINDTQDAEAGENVELTFCVSQGEFDLTDYLSEDANPNGSFEDFDGTINTSELGEGVFSYTYEVDETVECVTGEDSVDFTVTIIGDLNAGADQSTSICNANIENGMFPNSTSVRNYYLNMLDEGVSRNGTFSPSIQDLVNWYNNESEIGDFTTTYTISEGECSDSTELTVIVYESIPAEIDPIDDVTLCSIDEDQDLFSFLPEGADTNGYFEGYEDEMFSPSTTGAGEFDVTYTLDETSPCVTGSASATFTITVLETVTAGGDMTANFCTNDGDQDLYNLLDAQASTDGEFTYNDEPLVDGIFDVNAMGAGSYEVTYTVEPINECGVATSILTITVNTTPEAPTTNESIAFCAIDGETAARLEADGTNLTWYSDADLTMMVSEEDLLVNGEYYVTQSTDEGCESDAAMIMVNIVDSPAPTISSDYELCEFDNPTLEDLTAEINETGEVTWYDSADSMTALSNNAMLTDGTTYYATLISDNGCESSERLAVTVTLEDCALLFPEAITPNGDGRNDRLVIENIESEYPNYNITVFNRWGNAVYKGNASTPTWDGTSNQSGSLGDDVLPVGVYFYVVDFNDGSTEPRQGKVYLNR